MTAGPLPPGAAPPEAGVAEAEISAEACQRLWLRVLGECVKGAVAARLRWMAGRPWRATEGIGGPGIPAIDPSWIGSRDFLLVCDLAGIDGRRLSRALDAALCSEAACAELAAGFTRVNCGQGKRYRNRQPLPQRPVAPPPPPPPPPRATAPHAAEALP